jgi:hypothetical protein
MRLLPSDPDIKTIVSRIESGDVDLQPDFQRGEVWSDAKKQRLIDSILREWHVPPIHMIEVAETAKQEVLDGQQRLVSIRDFVCNAIPIDGKIEPYDPEIVALHGLRYHQLPDHWRRKFDQFTVRVFRIIDYRPGEPGELFYRLNQPTNLTAAEQRNAFFGPARQQVKRLVDYLESLGADKDFVGFSNSRMAYDDVIARLCVSIEKGTLREKVTAAVLANRYRSDQPFDANAYGAAKRAIAVFAGSRSYIDRPTRFNKATLYSWLYFFVNAESTGVLTMELIGRLVGYFEALRAKDSAAFQGFGWHYSDAPVPSDLLREVVDIYSDRSTARVNDTSSVLARDIALWCMFLNFLHVTGVEEPFVVLQFKAIHSAIVKVAEGRVSISGDALVGCLIQDFAWESAP